MFLSIGKNIHSFNNVEGNKMNGVLNADFVTVVFLLLQHMS